MRPSNYFRFILLCSFMLSFNTIIAETFPEGRTWWYTSTNYARQLTAEYTLRIGERIERNGTYWNKVELMDNGLFDSESNQLKSVELKSPQTVAYIRQDNTSVYFDYLTCEIDNQPIYYEPLHRFIGGAYTDFIDKKPVRLYDFGLLNSIYNIGESDSEANYEITDITEITNSGYNYRQFTSSLNVDNLSSCYCEFPEIMVYVEGIGAIDHPDSHCYPLFISPWGHSTTTSYDSYQLPRLRYVTDGENNDIIFEGVGGFKLWEDPLGVEAVEADENGTCEWFNLQGVKIQQPAAPGMYIRRTGNKTEKIRL